MRKLKLDRETLSRIAMIAAVYLVLDLVVQLTGYLNFGPDVGLKNFLPATVGLFFGIPAVVGTCIGCVLGGLILHTPWNNVAAECLMNLFVGAGLWLFWYRMRKPTRPMFKTSRLILRYIGLTLMLSLIGAMFASLLVGSEGFWRLFAAYGSLSILIGLAVNILLSSILCVEPVYPKGFKVKPDLAFTLTSSADSLMEFNEAVEDAAMMHRIGMKRVFELESCMEELSIRVFRNLPESRIKGTIRFSDAISIHLRYNGKPYNPFRMSSDEDELDTLSLKLLMHRALRAAHSVHAHMDGENRIHIVL